jgi:uncharacterized protein YmfQ (DUF2313 family)
MSELTSPRGLAMQRWLPDNVYGRSRLVAALLQGEGAEFDAIRAAMGETVEQWFVDTATWGLARWEAELGISPLPGASLQQRRELILARRRGFGTATLAQIKAVASSFAGGEIDLAEDYEAYTLYVIFVGLGGVPLNVQDLMDAVRAIVPANLAIAYLYRYSIWERLDAADLTWDELDALDLTWDQLDTYFV